MLAPRTPVPIFPTPFQAANRLCLRTNSAIRIISVGILGTEHPIREGTLRIPLWNRGLYKVQLIAGRCGLTDTTFQTINITMPVAVNTMGQANDLRISPNPVYDVLNFHQHYTKPTAYKIINLTGQTMHSGILPPAIRQIDVSRLPAGVYMMQLLDDRHPIALQKFMKQTQ